ncbi:hypothetical protein P7K49_028776 [Saguinus oedipus]|uniref:Uncharacterized protein n=1 Tax=Saguinus oedipus TaxID=9490 RepID=A0ABQ9U5B1_SAGOE|nr:hypothetical protein P7K49_028776 [Saguinus oedipus]
MVADAELELLLIVEDDSAGGVGALEPALVKDCLFIFTMGLSSTVVTALSNLDD